MNAEAETQAGEIVVEASAGEVMAEDFAAQLQASGLDANGDGAVDVDIAALIAAAPTAAPAQAGYQAGSQGAPAPTGGGGPQAPQFDGIAAPEPPPTVAAGEAAAAPPFESIVAPPLVAAAPVAPSAPAPFPVLPETGFQIEIIDAEDILADGSEEAKRRRAQRQEAVTSTQVQSARLTEALVIASMGVAAGAAATPALAAPPNEAAALPSGAAAPPQAPPPPDEPVFPEPPVGAGDAPAASPTAAPASPFLEQGAGPQATAGLMDLVNTAASAPSISTPYGAAPPAPADAPPPAPEGTGGGEPPPPEQPPEPPPQPSAAPAAPESPVGESLASDSDPFAADDAGFYLSVLGTGEDDVLTLDALEKAPFVDGRAGKDTLLVETAGLAALDAGARDIEVIVGTDGDETLFTSRNDDVTFFGGGFGRAAA